MKSKLSKIGKGAIIAALGAASAYLVSWSTGNGADLGAYGPMVAAGAAVVVNALNKAAEALNERP